MDILQLLQINAPTENLVERVKHSPALPAMLSALRKAVPDLTDIPHTTYTLFRQFEHTGVRGNYERQHFMKRSTGEIEAEG